MCIYNCLLLLIDTRTVGGAVLNFATGGSATLVDH